MKRIVLSVCLFFVVTAHGFAQIARTSVAVSNCNAIPSGLIPAPGLPAPQFIGPDGKLCVNASVAVGAVQLQDGSGNPVTSTGSALDVNVKTIAAAPNSDVDGDHGDSVADAPGASANLAITPCIIKSGTGTVADTSNHANCKASAGNFFGISYAINTTGTIAYLRMYNLASDPTCSSSTGFVESIPIPANTSGAGLVDSEIYGHNYSTGISYCVTGAGANNDNSAPPAGVYIKLKVK